MNLKRALIGLLVALAVAALFAACGKKQDDEGTCASFADYQIYPAVGGPTSVYELFVRLRDTDAAGEVVRLYADLYYSNGESAGVTYDLVRTEADSLRYLRTFRGEDVCETSTCSLFFKVYAETEDCTKSFETDMFQVVIDSGDDDAADDDDTDDDAEGDDTTDDDTTS